MKSIYSFLFLISVSLIARAQNFNLTFEDTAVINQVYYTDSILDPQHIWQIGVPNKPFFDSAYSPTNAVVTLLDSALPANTNASFIIKTEPSQYLFTYFTFEQKFDFDTLHGGGYIQYSIDTGHTWYNLTNRQGVANGAVPQGIIWRPVWEDYVPYDTLSGGNPYVTGHSNGWRMSRIYFPCFAVKTLWAVPLWYKFTAFSDSTNTGNHSGWMIDDLFFVSGSTDCGGINEINSSHLKVYPDPVVDGFTLSLVNTNVQDYELSIMDLMGRILMSVDEHEKEVTLRRGNISAGSYTIRVKDKVSGEMMEKRIVFE